MKSNKESSSNTDSLVSTLADRIFRETTEKGLAEGDFFMTVEQVSEQYDVSRTIAREAVGQLRALNILQSRQRKGLLIGRSDPIEVMSRCMRFYSEGTNGEELHTLAQLRYVLEIGAVDLAVTQATAEQIQRLVTIAKDAQVLTSTPGYDFKEEDDLDSAFHSQILAMTGNPLVIGMHRVVTDYFHVSKIVGQPPAIPASAQEHVMIADAFQRRDIETVRSLLRCHLERALESTAKYSKNIANNEEAG